MNRGRVAVALGACFAVLLVAGCGSSGSSSSPGSSSSGSSSSGTINVGNISSLTGPNVVPDGSKGATAYFDYLNEHGGINGQKVNFVVADDQGNPQMIAAAATRLITEENVVALVANSSIAECTINEPQYVQYKVLDIANQGIDSGCFQSPNIGPVDTGPFTALHVQLTYAVEVLKTPAPCVVLPNLPGIQAGDKEAIEAWEAETGKKLTLNIQNLDFTGDPTPDLLQAKSAGCTAIYTTGPAPFLAAFIKAAAAQNLTKTIKFLMPTTAYDPAFLSAAGSAANGVIVNSEFLPYTSKDPALQQPLKVFKAAGVPLGSQYLGGYLGAEIFATVVKGIKGPITRESVTEAFLHMAPFKTPLMGDPYIFGSGSTHNPNHASKFLEIVNGKYVELSPEWFRVPSN